MSPNARGAALRVLTQLLQQRGSLATLLPDYVSPLPAQAQSFAKELCYGCCRWYPLLDQLLSLLLSQPLKRKDLDVKAILLLGLYQLHALRTADHAAINETVQLARLVKKAWAKNLINALLRRFQRERSALLAEALRTCPDAHPDWLRRCIQQDWPLQSDDILHANNQHPPYTLRVNRQQTTRAAYQQQLQEAGRAALAATFSPVALYVDHPLPVDQLPGFAAGVVSVQDEAAQLAPGLLSLAPGLRVLDACCAPGGKTCHIVESEPALDALVALDVDERRLQKVRQNLTRLAGQGVAHGKPTLPPDRIQVVCADATAPDTWWDGRRFDRILLDAPCSGTGIIRRQPDIKLLRQPAQIGGLVQQQQGLLQALWPLLAEGGILVYATCSILPRENTRVVEAFIASRTDVVQQAIEADWGLVQPGGRQLLPQEKGHDGFFYACLKKHT